MPEEKKSNSDYQNQILKLTEGFGNLRGKVDQMDKHLSDNIRGLDRRTVAMHDSTKKVLENHDERLIGQEEETARIQGKTAGIAIVISLIISIIGILIALRKGFF